MKKLFIISAILLVPLCLPARQLGGKLYRQRADSLLQSIPSLYEVPKYGLLMETYPRNPKQQITYTANTGAEVTQQEVSFLWPYSAIVSGCVSLYKTTGDKQYKKLMSKQIKPGLDLYWDSTRQPACYQSYPAFAGQNDRYYDDNDWMRSTSATTTRPPMTRSTSTKPLRSTTTSTPDGRTNWVAASTGASRRRSRRTLAPTLPPRCFA